MLSAFIATSSSAEEKKEPFLLAFTNSVATTAGIGLLKETPLPPGNSEIRIWIGFGIVTPDEMLRIQVNSHGEVTGDVLVYFPSEFRSMKSREEKRFLRSILRNCTNLHEGTEKDVCTAKFKSTPDWTALYKELNHLGITILPDESELPKPDSVVFDGVSMVVEVRNGLNYRAYEYSNPAFRSEPEAKIAAQIMKLVADSLREKRGT